MSTITENQRACNQTIANRALQNLVPAMTQLCEAQKASMLALLAAATNTPCDIDLLGLAGDGPECAQLLDGVLPHGGEQWTWQTSSGCLFRVTVLPGQEEDPRG